MLHIVNKSPLERDALASCLRVVQSGAVLLIEDAVYAACAGHQDAEALTAAMQRIKVYALVPDLEARGVDDRVIEGVGKVDYAGFVELVVQHSANHSWL